VVYNVERIVIDMADREWNQADLARACKLSAMTIGDFLRGKHQTAKVAGKIAQALGKSKRRYFSHVEAA
jgi:transcriptional regulator with XRE-family HTH domain